MYVVDMSLIYLVTENLDLSVSAVYWLVDGSVYVIVRVYLYMQREPLHTFLTAEICAQTVHSYLSLQIHKYSTRCQ